MVALVVVAACASKPARPAEPWQSVAPGLYLYPEVIERYAPDDRGGYLVRPPAGATAEQRDALIDALAPADRDDIIADGVVTRLDLAGRDQVAARADVGAVAILQPEDRRGQFWDRDAAVAEVRIDLFADASDAERDAVATWLESRNGMVMWRGPAALRARLPRDVIAEVARLGPVRWVE